MYLRSALVIACWLCAVSVCLAQSAADEAAFPVVPELFADEPFSRCEGLAFNGEGRLFATCDRAFWEILPDGSGKKLVELDSNLGLAAVGERDLLVADFGPTNAFRHDRNSDGVVWRITPEGERSVDSAGFGDPNFVLVLPNGDYLVSDDATADIYIVDAEKNVRLYSTAVNHPNGLVLSNDYRRLYVAQIFTSIRPVAPDNTVWSLRLTDLKPAGRASLVARTGPGGANDGLAMDADGRLYIAANGEGRIWRLDPRTDELILIAEGMPGAASIAFGMGAFDASSIYVTTTFAAGLGGKIWRIPVGASAGTLHR
ncbi:MAG: SMP-30/gluconolactonase/LRE family protein [Gammaproteobacteria bacterium]|nr:SMP-30/gluconolactonase/LRE family protein [Gammaproteobacteria bacterium]